MKLEVKGKYNSAIVMTDQIEEECVGQLVTLCSQEIFKDSQIRIMPDCHAGKGCVVGFTASIKDRIIPNLVGVDISCSISTYKLDVKEVDFEQLDNVIRKYVPSGMSIRSTVSKLVSDNLKAKIEKVCQEIGDENGYNRHLKSIGTLGGGNHFLELNKDKDGYLWLSVHCGSRNFGKKICDFHQDKAIKVYQDRIDAKRVFALSQIPPKERQDWIKNHIDSDKLPPELRYLDGEDLDLYVEHMKVAEEFATVNHQVIVHEICSHMGWNVVDSIFTHHNYIEFLGNREMIIRKGAISAKKGERVIIPLNMKDGSIVGIGKGNEEWNQSAPHGAGRVLSRGKAKSVLSVEEFQDKMKDVWSSCVSESTLDESPMAYKDMNVIIDAIGETVDIVDRIIPIYNFKAQG
jgi:RNA-splicing ligase RtcB|nr:MAG TPA: tRNA-splicing ligase RtcB [Caudoviricetes sp.]